MNAKNEINDNNKDSLCPSPYPWWVTRMGSVCQNLMIVDKVKDQLTIREQINSLLINERQLTITSISSYEVIPAIRKNKII